MSRHLSLSSGAVNKCDHFGADPQLVLTQVSYVEISEPDRPLSLAQKYGPILLFLRFAVTFNHWQYICPFGVPGFNTMRLHSGTFRLSPGAPKNPHQNTRFAFSYPALENRSTTPLTSFIVLIQIQLNFLLSNHHHGT